MTRQDKTSSKAGASGTPKRRNPGIEVVNVYGSGPLPVGPRPEGRPRKKPKDARPENPGALSTSQEGKIRSS